MRVKVFLSLLTPSQHRLINTRTHAKTSTAHIAYSLTQPPQHQQRRATHGVTRAKHRTLFAIERARPPLGRAASSACDKSRHPIAQRAPSRRTRAAADETRGLAAANERRAPSSVRRARAPAPLPLTKEKTTHSKAKMGSTLDDNQFRMWRAQLVPCLYDWIANQHLTWPTQAVR